MSLKEEKEKRDDEFGVLGVGGSDLLRVCDFNQFDNMRGDSLESERETERRRA